MEKFKEYMDFSSCLFLCMHVLCTYRVMRKGDNESQPSGKLYQTGQAEHEAGRDTDAGGTVATTLTVLQLPEVSEQ